MVLGCTTCSCNAVLSYGRLITTKILTDHKSARAQVIFICHNSVTFHPSFSLKRKRKKKHPTMVFDSRNILTYFFLVSYGNKYIILTLYSASINDLLVL